MTHTNAYFISNLRSIENIAKKLRKTAELKSQDEAYFGQWYKSDLAQIEENLNVIWYHYSSCKCEEIEEQEDKE